MDFPYLDGPCTYCPLFRLTLQYIGVTMCELSLYGLLLHEQSLQELSLHRLYEQYLHGPTRFYMHFPKMSHLRSLYLSPTKMFSE
jgi:hypothetical protein